MATVSHEPWSNFSQSDYTPAQWAAACILDTGEGNPDVKSRYKLPIKEPDGEINANALGAAAGRLNQVDASPDERAAAARKLVAAYRIAQMDIPDSLANFAGVSRSAEWFGLAVMRSIDGSTLPFAIPRLCAVCGHAATHECQRCNNGLCRSHASWDARGMTHGQIVDCVVSSAEFE